MDGSKRCQTLSCCPPGRPIMACSFAVLRTAFLLAAASCAPAVAQALQPVESLHYRPKDHLLGDVHPFFKDGECYLYYLKPGKFESALVRSRDFLHWTPAEISHAPTGPGDWMSPYYVLGVFHDRATGLYRSFYGHVQGRMVSSISSDLLTWSCAPKEFHVPPADYYHRRRDPFVFWIPEMKQYGCVMTTWMKGRSKEQGGAVSLALSSDLKQWTDKGPILDPGNIGEPECPQMFKLGNQWYLLTSIYDRAVGAPVYWTSASPLGPWQGEPGLLDGKDLCAAQIGWDGETPLLFGWIPLNPARPGKQTWGGHLALVREVYEVEPGVLATRLAPKVAATVKALTWQVHPDVAVNGKGPASISTGARLVAECDAALPEQGDGLRMRLAPLGEVRLERQRLAILDGKGECWSELPVALPAGKPVHVQVFAEGDVIEVFVDGRYSLAARLPRVDGALSLGFEGNAVSVTGLRITK